MDKTLAYLKEFQPLIATVAAIFAVFVAWSNVRSGIRTTLLAREDDRIERRTVSNSLKARVAVIDWTALGLLGLVVMMIAALVLLGAGPNTLTVERGDIAIVTEIAVPTALMIGIQWWLVRRRRRPTSQGRNVPLQANGGEVT